MTTLHYRPLYVETFYDRRRDRVRVRPLPGQWASSGVLVECSRGMRSAHPIGTVFYLDIAWKGHLTPDTHLYAHAESDHEVLERAEAERRIARGE